MLNFFEVGGGEDLLLTIDPTMIDFGDILVGESSTEEFSLTNTSEEEISGEISTPEGFEVSAVRNLRSIRKQTRNTLEFTLSVGEVLDYELTFSPTATIEYDDFVTVDCTEPQDVQYLLEVNGTGIEELIPPENLITTIENYNEVMLAWDAPETRQLNNIRVAKRDRDLIGYNVYLDGEQVESEISETTYDYTDGLDSGNYEFAITAVYDSGESEELTSSVEIELAVPEMGDAVLDGNSVELNWSIAGPVRNRTKKRSTIANNRELTNYLVYRDDLEEPIANVTETQYTDELDSFGIYEYWVVAVYTGDYDSDESNHITIEYTSTDNNDIVPAITELANNYPNPFNPKTEINYSLKESGNITIAVYNTKGQKVKELVNEVKESGKYSVTWQGKDTKGKDVPSGIYFYRMKTDRYTSTKKMILLK